MVALGFGPRPAAQIATPFFFGVINDSIGAGATEYFPPNASIGTAGETTESFVKMTVPSAGVLSGFRARANVANWGLTTGGETGAIVLRVNGVDQLTLAIANGEAEGTEVASVSSVTLAAGDDLSVKITHTSASARTVRAAITAKFLPS